MILTVTLNAAIDKRYVVSSFTEGEVNRVRECSYTPGGKGLNVSKAAVLVGAEVVATGFVGGYAGIYIEDQLKKLSVKSQFFHLQNESRSCINIWNEEKELQTEILEPGFQVTGFEQSEFVRLFEGLLEEAGVVVLSGSIPQGIEEDIYRQLIQIANKRRIPVILDTSGASLVLGIEANPTVIKPNIDEIRMLTGKSCSTRGALIQAAQELHDDGIPIVVISMGKEGAVMVCEEGVFQTQIPKINTVNTVGCGDTMIAGFAVGLERKLGRREMLKEASAMSAAAALREETGYFAEKDRYAIYQQISVICC